MADEDDARNSDQVIGNRHRVRWVDRCVDGTDLIYVADPMCSWCWGFAPSIDALAARHPDLPIRVVTGGLRPGPAAEPLDDRLRSFLAHHWEEVARRSGQPFDHRALDRGDWRYDTEVPDTAIVTMRTLSEADTLAFLGRLQRAFYAELVDVTDPGEYRGLVEPFDVDPDEFDSALRSEEMKKLTWRDFAWAHKMGIGGFPTVIGRRADTGTVLARGWLPPDALDQTLHAWLEGIDAELGATGSCAVGEPC